MQGLLARLAILHQWNTPTYFITYTHSTKWNTPPWQVFGGWEHRVVKCEESEDDFSLNLRTPDEWDEDWSNEIPRKKCEHHHGATAQSLVFRLRKGMGVPVKGWQSHFLSLWQKTAWLPTCNSPTQSYLLKWMPSENDFTCETQGLCSSSFKSCDRGSRSYKHWGGMLVTPTASITWLNKLMHSPCAVKVDAE